MTSRDSNAAKAANDDARLTVPQAAELLSKGKLLKQTSPEHRDALRQQLGITKEMTRAVIALVDAEASAGLIACLGPNAASNAAIVGLYLCPASKITAVYSELDGAQLFEFVVPTLTDSGWVTYYNHTQTDGRIARSVWTLRRRIELRLTSIEASSAEKFARYHVGEEDVTPPQQIRDLIADMQARGLRFNGSQK